MVSEEAQHPPGPTGRRQASTVIDDNPVIVADAEPLHLAREQLGRRDHMRQAGARLRDADELSELFRDAGVALDRPIVTSCGSGVTACALAFALHLIGHPGAAVYDGSWSEWGLPGDTPVETGAAPAKTP